MDETTVPKTSHKTVRIPKRPARKKSRLNWPYALVSILIGTLLWFGIDMRRMEDRELDVSIAFQRPLPSGWKFVDPPPAAAKVKVRGPRQEVGGLRNNELRLDPDLPASELVGNYFDVSVPLLATSMRGLPPGVEVVAIAPEMLNIKIAKTMTKYLTVTPGEITGKPQDGYVVGKVVQIDPPAMPISGFESFLSKIGSSDVLKTLPFSVEGGSGRVGAMVGLEPFEKDGETIRIPGMAYMTVELDEVPASRDFEQLFEVRALIESPFDRYSDLNVSPPSVKVSVSGPKTVVDKLREGDIIIYVDIRDRVPAAQGEFNLKCKAIAPARVRVTKIEPDTVKWITRDPGPSNGK